MSEQTTEEQVVNIHDWSQRIIEGIGGMNDYERYEMVVWHTSERVAAANWVLRCLANPKCEHSASVLKAIIERRQEQGDDCDLLNFLTRSK